MSRGTAPASCLAGPGEPLDRHLVEVMEEARRDPAFEPVARKLARVFNVRPELAMDLLEFAALVHDVGKADERYKNAVEYFPLHESRSADFAYYVLVKAGLLRSVVAPHVGSMVVIAVALHHYSHKTFSHGATADGFTFRRGVITGGFKARCNAHIEAFKSWTPRTAEGATLKSIAASTLEVEQYNIYSAVLSSINDINNDEKLRNAAAAVLGLLNKADGAVAKRNRRASA
jgi:CRISPR/Cas system-associated endonuclease Cas3-HD